MADRSEFDELLVEQMAYMENLNVAEDQDNNAPEWIEAEHCGRGRRGRRGHGHHGHRHGSRSPPGRHGSPPRHGHRHGLHHHMCHPHGHMHGHPFHPHPHPHHLHRGFGMAGGLHMPPHPFPVPFAPPPAAAAAAAGESSAYAAYSADASGGRRFGRWGQPSFDVVEAADGAAYIILGDVPGIAIADVSVEVANNGVQIRGKCDKRRPEGARLIHAERRAEYSFERTFVLPGPVRAADIMASLHGGVLEVTLPKDVPAGTRVRIVPVQGASPTGSKETQVDADDGMIQDAEGEGHEWQDVQNGSNN